HQDGPTIPRHHDPGEATAELPVQGAHRIVVRISIRLVLRCGGATTAGVLHPIGGADVQTAVYGETSIVGKPRPVRTVRAVPPIRTGRTARIHDRGGHGYDREGDNDRRLQLQRYRRQQNFCPAEPDGAAGRRPPAPYASR
ncbi:hypothetical protein, partial [Candidatus Protofrankia californiensis]|uniref:hypothetical protein n=1 Tax=Candidatus Protofrankia californiensis TaxID=1839754 RepID=UPI0013EABFFE